MIDNMINTILLTNHVIDHVLNFNGVNQPILKQKLEYMSPEAMAFILNGPNYLELGLIKSSFTHPTHEKRVRL